MTTLAVTQSESAEPTGSKAVRLRVGGAVVMVTILGGLLASLALGAVDISVAEVLAVLTGEASETTKRIVLDARLPRALCPV